jgi:hypothetical protein
MEPRRVNNIEGAYFPPLIHPFAVAELGGWPRAYSDLMETLWKNEIQPRLDLEVLPAFLEPGEQK